MGSNLNMDSIDFWNYGFYPNSIIIQKMRIRMVFQISVGLGLNLDNSFLNGFGLEYRITHSEFAPLHPMTKVKHSLEIFFFIVYLFLYYFSIHKI